MIPLERKIDAAIKLLRNIPQDGPLELCYSGGKDSDVILTLARMAGIKFEAIYKNTTIDPPGTISHVKENGCTIVNPKETFFQLVERKGTPSRWKRFCFEVLKEYKIHDRAIMGIRRQESSKRMQNYKEPEMCRVYPNKEKVRIYLPILEWSLDDVARFIEDKGVKLAPHYYDNDRTVHYERRLGCLGCPLKSDCGKADFLKFPKFLQEYIRRYQKFLDAHPKDTAFRKMIRNDAYHAFFYFLFTHSSEEFLNLTDGLLADANVNPEQYIKNYFGI